VKKKKNNADDKQWFHGFEKVGKARNLQFFETHCKFRIEEITVA